ncbi:MAG: glycosyltransferase family 4 protein [Paracoccaceae bacterium]
MPTRIAFLNTHPIQYFAPLYADLNRAEDLEITALYLTDVSLRGGVDKGFGQVVSWDVDLLAGYTAHFAASAKSAQLNGGFFSLMAPDLWRTIRRERYDALVIFGHNKLAQQIALLAARSVGTRVFYRADTHLGKTRAGLRRHIRPWIMGAYFRLFHGCLAIGQQNQAYYRAMGVPDHKIFRVPFAVDNARFAEQSEMSEDARKVLRAEWGVTDDRPVVSFAAKLVAQKRPSELIEACALLAARGVRFHLLMAGAGPEQASLEALAAERLPPGSYHFPGFVNQSALPAMFGASEVFVLPSTNEAWGLTVNEAMAAGLPVVICREIGCAPDLLCDGENGYALAPGDVAGMADALESVIADPAHQRAMSNASRKIVDRFSFAECEAGLRQAVSGTADV